MSRHSRVTPQESGGQTELSDFTTDLLENLKGEFKNNLKRSGNNPAKENKLSLSLLADSIHGSNGNPNSISDEIFIFNHIINCTNSLVEVIDQQSLGNEKDTGKSLFYSGLLNHISKMVKTTVVFSAPEAKASSTAIQQQSNEPTSVYRSDIDRLFLTSHSLMTFPQLAANTSLYSSQKVPLLHYAVHNSCNFSLVKAVYFSNPDAIKAPDKEGALPLHWASLGTDIRIVEFLLEKYPAAAGETDSNGYLPLHWAVNQDSPCVNIYKLLINAFPQGVSLVSPQNGTLPLHWCVNRAKPDVNLVKELIMAHSAGLRTPCADGWLPLHYCVNHGDISFEILTLLLSRYPNAVMYKNKEGQLPVHRLLDRDDCSKKALQMLINVTDECLLVSDNEGYLPLHVALDGSNPPSWRLIKLLLQHGPEAIKKKTNNQFLPLHIAMKMTDTHGSGGKTEEATKGMVALDEPLSDDEFGEETIAKLNANRYLSIIQELTSAYPEAVHDVAIDILPIEANISDIFTYTGGWKKSRWTPMSRAISKGKNSPIASLLRPFQKQKKPPTVKSAGNKVIAVNRMGGPLVSLVSGSQKKLGEIVVQKGDKVPRRPPPRAKKKEAPSTHEAIIDANKQQHSVKKNLEKEKHQDEVERLKKEHDAAHELIEREKMAQRIQSASRLKAARRKREQMKAQKSVRLEAEKMAEENKAQPRIYTADMKAAGFYDDNDVSIIDDDNGLKFNQDGSSNRLNIS